MSTRVLAVVPARLNSSRFPGKVLHPFRGKPLISFLLTELLKSKRIDRLVVATDSKEVERGLRRFDVEIARTSSKHRTGTDRVEEISGRINSDIILNIQADNFGLKAGTLDRAIDRIRAHRSVEYATLARRVRSDEELFDPNAVKVALSDQDQALWFSRYPLPYLQKPKPGMRSAQFRFHYHIGVYLFRRRALSRFARWPRTPFERAESLEQLRVLEHGYPMHVMRTSARTVSIDTAEDLEKLEAVYR